jgi:hypothetical protein
MQEHYFLSFPTVNFQESIPEAPGLWPVKINIFRRFDCYGEVSVIKPSLRRSLFVLNGTFDKKPWMMAALALVSHHVVARPFRRWLMLPAQLR